MSDVQRVGVSFAKLYFSRLVDTPDSLASLYSPTARSTHQGRTSTDSVAALLESCYPKHSVSTAHINTVDTILAVGSTEVTVKGTLTMKGEERPFQYTAQLREVQKKAYVIISDELRFVSTTPAAGKTASWALESPELKPSDPPAVPEEVNLDAAAEETHETKETEASEVEKEKEEEKEVEQPAVDLSGLSLAERLRLTSQNTKTVSSPPPKTVVIARSTEKKEEEKNEKKKDDGKKKTPNGPAAAATNGKRADAAKTGKGAEEDAKDGGDKRRRERRPRGGLVFYDVVVKGLPQDADEATVRELIGNKAEIKLVKVESSPAKKDASQMRTFAFVQLDHAALKKNNVELKKAIEEVLQDAKSRITGKDIRVEEVHERRLEKKAEN